MDWKDQLEPDTQKNSKVRQAKRSKISYLSKLSKKSKDPEIIKLAKELQDENWEVRKKAVKALWGLKEKTIPLLTIALEDDNMWVRVAADEAIRHIYEELETELIAEEINTSKTELIAEEINTSNQIISQFIEILNEGNSAELNVSAFKKSGINGEGALNHLLQILIDQEISFKSMIEKLRKEGYDIKTRFEQRVLLISKRRNFILSILEVLVLIGKEINDLSALIKLLNLYLCFGRYEGGLGKERFVCVLEEIGTEQVIPPLIDVLPDENVDVSCAAHSALVKFGKKGLLPIAKAIKDNFNAYGVEKFLGDYIRYADNNGIAELRRIGEYYDMIEAVYIIDVLTDIVKTNEDLIPSLLEYLFDESNQKMEKLFLQVLVL